MITWIFFILIFFFLFFRNFIFYFFFFVNSKESFHFISISFYFLLSINFFSLFYKNHIYIYWFDLDTFELTKNPHIVWFFIYLTVGSSNQIFNCLSFFFFFRCSSFPSVTAFHKNHKQALKKKKKRETSTNLLSLSPPSPYYIHNISQYKDNKYPKQKYLSNQALLSLYIFYISHSFFSVLHLA